MTSLNNILYCTCHVCNCRIKGPGVAFNGWSGAKPTIPPHFIHIHIHTHTSTSDSFKDPFRIPAVEIIPINHRSPLTPSLLSSLHRPLCALRHEHESVRWWWWWWSINPGLCCDISCHHREHIGWLAYRREARRRLCDRLRTCKEETEEE